MGVDPPPPHTVLVSVNMKAPSAMLSYGTDDLARMIHENAVSAILVSFDRLDCWHGVSTAAVC